MRFAGMSGHQDGCDVTAAQTSGQDGWGITRPQEFFNSIGILWDHCPYMWSLVDLKIFMQHKTLFILLVV